ncbi:MAG: hypothetical protein CL623_10505 [Arcobacter sp.]|nr:hypothetical protein [Arcobacter sp.]|tara:strand:- start:6096 stop:6569 length:474 start_codon:yes stop_codon:yes gene_type:complete
MKELKERILKVITPKAVLYPLTNEANKSIINDPCETFLIRMSEFPYRIGRESRVGENEKGLFVKLRVIKNISKPVNDTYLYDSGKNLQISKEHLQIEKNNETYTLKDRGSSNGTTINGTTYGGNRQVFEHTLKDGDIIAIGDKKSEFKYQFLILENL